MTMHQRRSSAGRRYTKRGKGFALPSILFRAGKVVLTIASISSARCIGSQRHTAWWSMTEVKRTDPRQWQVALEWLERADGDIRVGVLIARRVEPPKSHDIELLGRLVGRHESELGEKITALTMLTVW